MVQWNNGSVGCSIQSDAEILLSIEISLHFQNPGGIDNFLFLLLFGETLSDSTSHQSKAWTAKTFKTEKNSILFKQDYSILILFKQDYHIYVF